MKKLVAAALGAVIALGVAGPAEAAPRVAGKVVAVINYMPEYRELVEDYGRVVIAGAPGAQLRIKVKPKNAARIVVRVQPIRLKAHCRPPGLWDNPYVDAVCSENTRRAVGRSLRVPGSVYLDRKDVGRVNLDPLLDELVEARDNGANGLDIRATAYGSNGKKLGTFTVYSVAELADDPFEEL